MSLSLLQLPYFYVEDERCASESDFRGFQKSPIVLCERIDIKPYLNGTLTSSKEKSSILKSYIKTCTVNIVREDLEQLKKVHLNKLKKNYTVEQRANETIIRCNICEKAYISAKRLQNHVEKKHMLVIKSQPCKTLKRVSFSDHIVVHEVKEYHKCRKCSKIFEDYICLKAHMKQVHKKRNCFICFYCSRQFVDRMFFKVHIKMHCSLCGVFFSNKIQLYEHRRTVCKDFKKYNCKTCNSVFFSSMARKDHSYQHDSNTYVCDVCKERFNDKCVLSHHIQSLHSRNHHKSFYSMINDHTKLYECNFCSSQFSNEMEIKEHVSKLPKLHNKRTKGYKDYYFCDQCSEQFAIETDMLQHKWIHFLKKDPWNNKEISTLKQTYRINEELPKFLQPKLILHKLKQTKVPLLKNPSTRVFNTSNPIPNLSMKTRKNTSIINYPELTKLLNHSNGDILFKYIESNVSKVPIFHPFTKRKILFSKHQCKNCCKYFSSNYCLNRHIQTVHIDKELLRSITNDDLSSLQCPKCEEVFVWPSLLQSHNCIRMRIPEMSFDDARPEIQVHNVLEYSQDWLDYGHDVEYVDDIEMPAPIVQLTEYDDYKVDVNGTSGHVDVVYEKAAKLHNGNAQFIIQEVPVEF